MRVLEKFHIRKAHFLGFSMGGQVGQFVGAYHPDHISSLILLGTSTDFKPGFDAFSGDIKKDSDNKKLSPPKPDYVAWATRDVNVSHQTLDEKVDDYIKTWRRLDGESHNFNEDHYRKEGVLNYTRSRLHTPYLSHAKAMKASFEDHENAPALITASTLIIQGGHDPVFGIDHGRALHSRIKNSKLIVWEDFAHAVSPQNYDRLIEVVDQFLKKNVKR